MGPRLHLHPQYICKGVKMNPNQTSVDKTVHAEIAGVVSDFKLRETIKGDALEMGPYSPADAEKIATEINGSK